MSGLVDDPAAITSDSPKSTISIKPSCCQIFHQKYYDYSSLLWLCNQSQSRDVANDRCDRPSKTPFSFFLGVSTYPRISKNSLLDVNPRKQPLTFCCTLIIRIGTLGIIVCRCYGWTADKTGVTLFVILKMSEQNYSYLSYEKIYS